MSGYYGDLSVHQQQALDLMKRSAQGDDHTLLRFLRARKFVVESSLELYNNYLKYRKESGIEKILDIKIPKTKEFNRLIPNALHGFDKAGRPIYIEKTGLIDFDTVYGHMSDEDLMRIHCWQMEMQIKRCEESSRRLGHTVDTFSTIIDLTGLSMAGRKGVGLIRLMAAHDQVYHPERLGRVYVINAPWVFPFFWKICSAFLDENTTSKIHILGKNYQQELLKDIDADQLPEEFGGSCRCENGCVHVSDISDLKAAAGANASEDVPLDKNINSKECFELDVPAGPTGATFEWSWQSASKDLLFSVEVIGDEKAAIKTLTAADRMTAHKGSYETQRNVTLRFKWDNTHSRWTSKNIKYLVKATPFDKPRDEVKLDNESSVYQEEDALSSKVRAIAIQDE